MAFEALIFIPNAKKRYDPLAVIGYSMWGTASLTFICLAILKPPLGVTNFINPILYFFIGIPAVIGFVNFFLCEPLNGVIKGILKIENGEIIFNDKAIEFTNITNIDFKIDKYYGELLYPISYGRGISPGMSQGVNNSICINTKSGEKTTIYFRLSDKEAVENLRTLVKQLTIKNKVHLLRAVSLLQLTYKEVEELKGQIGGGQD